MKTVEFKKCDFDADGNGLYECNCQMFTNCDHSGTYVLASEAQERERVLVETLECTLSALRIASRQLTEDMKMVLNGKRWGEYDIKRAEKVLGIKP